MQSIAGSRTSCGSPVIQRKCSCSGSCSSCSGKEEELGILPKLKVGPVNDMYEQEADRVADQVMRMPKVSVFTQQKPVAGILKEWARVVRERGDKKTADELEK